MGLHGYRAFRDTYHDNGVEISDILQTDYEPDFRNRHTIQLWDAGVYNNINIKKWKGTTLANRSLHEIYIVNNSNASTLITFSTDYRLEDEESFDISGFQTITIGANGTAYFYCTAVLDNNNLVFEMRTGSQDNKNI